MCMHERANTWQLHRTACTGIKCYFKINSQITLKRLLLSDFGVEQMFRKLNAFKFNLHARLQKEAIIYLAKMHLNLVDM